MLRRPAGATQIRSQHRAAQVHVRLWLHQTDWRTADLTAHDTRLTVAPPALETPNVGEVVEHPPADVVSRALVLLPRIAEADDHFHRPRVSVVVASKEAAERAKHDEEPYDSSP